MLPSLHLNLRKLIPYNMLEIRMLWIEEKIAEVRPKGDHNKANSYVLNLKVKGITTRYKRSWNCTDAISKIAWNIFAFCKLVGIVTSLSINF